MQDPRIANVSNRAFLRIGRIVWPKLDQNPSPGKSFGKMPPGFASSRPMVSALINDRTQDAHEVDGEGHPSTEDDPVNLSRFHSLDRAPWTAGVPPAMKKPDSA
jgi:hypothetical protein